MPIILLAQRIGQLTTMLIQQPLKLGHVCAFLRPVQADPPATSIAAPAREPQGWRRSCSSVVSPGC